MHLALRHNKFIVSLVLLGILLASFAPAISNAQVQVTVTGTSSPTNLPSTVTGAPSSNTGTDVSPVGAGKIDFCADLGGCIAGLVYILPAISADISYLASMFFSAMAQLTLSSTGYGINFLQTGWKIALTLANLAFLLILVYIALTIMFEADTAGTMKMLAMLIVMALLVNFSFFITRVVIDGGNLLATTFYNDINAATFAQEGGAAGTASAVASAAGVDMSKMKDLTYPIMQVVGLQTLLNQQTFTTLTGEFDPSKGGSVLSEIITLSFIFILVAVIYWIFIFAFITTGGKFMIRTILLWFIIMAAPLAFAMGALLKNPSAKRLFDQWKEKLIELSIYPVVFFLIFYVIVETSQQILCTSASSTNCTLGALVTNSQLLVPNTQIAGQGTGLTQLFLNLANIAIRVGIIIAMLYFGLRAADILSGEGKSAFANLTNKATKGVGNFVSKRARNAGGYVGQRTVGAGAQRINNKLIDSRFGNTRLGYGFRKKVFEPITKNRFGGSESHEVFLARTKKEDQERADNLKRIDTRDTVKRIGQDIKDKKTISLQDKNKVEKLSKRELEMIGSEDLVAVAHLLSTTQIEKYIKGNDKFAEEDQEKIETAGNQRIRSGPNSKKVLSQEVKDQRDLEDKDYDNQLAQRKVEGKQRANEMAQRAQVRKELGGNANIPTTAKQQWLVEGSRWQTEDLRYKAEDAARAKILENRKVEDQNIGNPEAVINKVDMMIDKIDDLQRNLGNNLKQIPLEIKDGERLTTKSITDALQKIKDANIGFKVDLDMAKRGGDKAKIQEYEVILQQGKDMEETLKTVKDSLGKVGTHISEYDGRQVPRGELDIIKK